MRLLNTNIIGLPKILLIDNGSSFKSKRVEENLYPRINDLCQQDKDLNDNISLSGQADLVSG